MTELMRDVNTIVFYSSHFYIDFSYLLYENASFHHFRMLDVVYEPLKFITRFII